MALIPIFYKGDLYVDTASDDEIRDELKFFLHEDEMVSVPLKRAITNQAKKEGILL